MECKFCGEKDESMLMMSSSLVDGKVEHEWVCLRCFWINRSNAEGKREDGILREEKSTGKRIFTETKPAVTKATDIIRLPR